MLSGRTRSLYVLQHQNETKRSAHPVEDYRTELVLRVDNPVQEQIEVTSVVKRTDGLEVVPDGLDK